MFKLKRISYPIRDLFGSILSLGIPPDFLIIGAQKSGTSYIATQLRMNKMIVMANRMVRVKGGWGKIGEPHFFTDNYAKGIKWYLSRFHLTFDQRYMFRNGEKLLLGDKSPSYLRDSSAPKRLKEHFPGVKLIVVLRDPVDRAYSQYHMDLDYGLKEYVSFEDLIDEQINDWKMSKDNFDNYPDLIETNIGRGIYCYQIENWMKYFKPNQFLVLNAQEMIKNPQDIMNRIGTFLGIGELRIKQKVINSRAYPAMNVKTKRRLKEFYEPYNQRLYKFLGRDFGWNNSN